MAYDFMNVDTYAEPLAASGCVDDYGALLWPQDRGNTEAIGSQRSPTAMVRSVTAPGRSVFVIKTSFWMQTG
jgi:hypothetical protein